MHRLAIALVLVGISAPAIAKAPTAPKKPATSAQQPSQPARPNATATCSIALTQPDAYTHDYTSLDYCVADPNGTILFEPKVIVNGVADRPERDLSVHVDPSLTAGSMVTLTTMGQGQRTDKVWISYSGETNETRCLNPSGTATVVTPRPNLDVKFDLTCMMQGPAQGLRIVGEFTSTL